jgi:phosphoglycolate phosphatase-like HAD superfamily hydrolase
LKERHVGVGLVSNIGRRAVEQGSAALGIAGAFDVVVTRNDVERLKPCGDGIRLALARLGVSQGETWFVGDSVSDVLAARDAGVAVAIVQGGESAPTLLHAAGPDRLWRTLGELETLYGGGEPTR